MEVETPTKAENTADHDAHIASIASEAAQKAIAALMKQDKPEAKAIHAPAVITTPDQYTVKDYVNAIYTKDYSKLSKIIESKTLEVGTNTEGGYTVPTEIHNEVWKIVDDYGIAAQQVRRYSMTSNKLDLPQKNAGVTWYKVTEEAAITKSAPTFSANVSLDATDYLGALVVSSKQLLRDSAGNIQAYLSEEFGYGLAKFLDAEILAGDGTNFTGVLNAASSNVITMGSGDTAITDFTADDASAMIDALTSGERRGAAYYFNKKVAGILRTLRSSDGTYVYSDPKTADAATLYGYPVYYVEDDILPAAPSTSTKFGVFGSLRNVALGVREDQTSLEVSDSATVDSVSMFETNGLAWKMTMRGAIAVMGAGAPFAVVRTAAS